MHWNKAGCTKLARPFKLEHFQTIAACLVNAVSIRIASSLSDLELGV